MNAVVIVNKPRGPSSNGVCARIKRLLGIRRIGHLGTLDPLATGVLPLFLEQATRLVPLFEGLDKTYRVTLKLGETTDTLDALGQVVATRPLDDLSPRRVREAILAREGVSEQQAPDYSALKHGGVPAYRLARQGKAVPPRVRTIRLEGLSVESVELPLATFTVTCSSGAYMRSLVGDIGAALGTGAHLTALERLRCGDLFTLANSFTLDAIERAVEREHLSFLINPSALLVHHLPFRVDGAEAERIRHGSAVPLAAQLAHYPVAAPVQALDADGRLIAVGEVVALENERPGFRPNRVLA